MWAATELWMETNEHTSFYTPNEIRSVWHIDFAFPCGGEE